MESFVSIDNEKLATFVDIYKIPLLLASCGLLLLILSIVVAVRSSSPVGESAIVFSHDTSASAAAALTAEYSIDIEGQVAHPGVYKLLSGSRINDAIALAGGLSAKADSAWISKNMNLAAKVSDGGKIYIPAKGETQTEQSQAQVVQGKSQTSVLGVSTGKVNINTASLSQLDTLPSVGQVTAQKIIDGRPYGSIEELVSKKVIGQATLTKLHDLIVAE